MSRNRTPEPKVRLIEDETSAERFALSLVERGALFAVSHSGGKDSQAMLIHLRRLGVPQSQMILFHADLGDVMWPDAMPHIEAYADGLDIIEALPATGFFAMVDRRRMFLTPSVRQCTSDLKRGPIEREIRRWLARHPDHSRVVVSCMGLRSDESRDRAMKPTLKWSERNSKRGREWYDWLPIHGFSKARVFETIREAGQEPHRVYGLGFSRYSCPFCFYGSDDEHRRAAQLMPALYANYCQRETRQRRLLPKPHRNSSRKRLNHAGQDPCHEAWR